MVQADLLYDTSLAVALIGEAIARAELLS